MNNSLNITTYQLINLSAHIGYKNNIWDDKASIYVYKLKKNQIIFNLNKVITNIKKTINLIQLLSNKNNFFLTILTKSPQIYSSLSNVNIQVLTSWSNGTLTRFKKIIKTKQATGRILKDLKKYKKNKLITLVTKLPSLIFVDDSHIWNNVLKESNKLLIPSSGFSNPISSSNLLQYPIILTNSLPLNKLIKNLIKKAILIKKKLKILIKIKKLKYKINTINLKNNYLLQQLQIKKKKQRFNSIIN